MKSTFASWDWSASLRSPCPPSKKPGMRQAMNLAALPLLLGSRPCSSQSALAHENRQNPHRQPPRRRATMCSGYTGNACIFY